MISQGKRGRPKGSRARLAAGALGVRVAGAATSAAKMNIRVGVADVSGWWVYVPREGFVRWSEIEAQVAEAYLQWRRKKAQEGILVFDWAESFLRHGRAAKQPGRQSWLREWEERHAMLCERASA